MLTFLRKSNASVVIFTPDGDEIRILVHAFEDDHINVSIDASPAYVIAREEILSEPIF